MSNTYSQIYLQFVFAVMNRQALIPKEHKEELHQYIIGLVQNRNAKMLAINCIPDHTHLFIGYKPVTYIPDLIKEIKVESNELINSKKWNREKFGWQDARLNDVRAGVWRFSYSPSLLDRVIKYINNQEVHHQKRTFKSEYLELLQKFDISFEEKYLFDF